MVRKRIFIGWFENLPENTVVGDLINIHEGCPPDGEDSPVAMLEVEAKTELECDGILFRKLFHDNWTAQDSMSHEQIWDEVRQEWF